MVRIFAVLPLIAGAMKCGDVKMHYKESKCCGNPENEVDGLMDSADMPACPYNFDKPACADAGVQSPRNVTSGSPGYRPGRFSPLNDAQASKLMQTNVHIHLGAEHYSGGQYDHHDDEHRRLSEAEGGVKPGYMCNEEIVNKFDTMPGMYQFEHCIGMEVGKSYEIHWVYSSAGVLGEDPFLTDGLGQAANGRSLLNPFVAVQAQVFFVVNSDDPMHNFGDELIHGGAGSIVHSSARYAGSTTGPSHTNEVCSPYAVTWLVDKECHPISAKSLDNLCRNMKEMYGLKADLHAHGSRDLVDPEFVVPFDEVMEEKRI